MAPSAMISCGLRTSRTSGASGPDSLCSNDRASISVICTSANLGRIADLVEQIAHVFLHFPRGRQVADHDASPQRAGAAGGRPPAGKAPPPPPVRWRAPRLGMKGDAYAFAPDPPPLLPPSS